MKPTEFEWNPEAFTIGRLAALLGVTTENIRALERRGRLPEGCEPAIDEMTGTRYWTRAQAERLKIWNNERTERKRSVQQEMGESNTE